MHARSRTLHLLPSSNLHFSFSKFPWKCSLRFFTFLPHFYRFYAHLTAFDCIHWGFYVLISFSSLGILFCRLYWFGTTPIDGVFCFYTIASFSIQLKLLILSFDVEITFWEFEVKVFGSVFVIPDLKSLCAPFPCLAKFVYWLLDEKCNEALRLCLFREICHIFVLNSWNVCGEYVNA